MGVVVLVELDLERLWGESALFIRGVHGVKAPELGVLQAVMLDGLGGVVAMKDSRHWSSGVVLLWGSRW